jgi:ATP-dependent Clp protease adaptor protein ClpS
MHGGNDFGEGREESPLDLIQRRETKLERPGQWHVVFFNDEVTGFDFVTNLLISIFHWPTLEAFGIAFEIHVIGKGIAGTYSFEVAREKRSEVLGLAQIEQFPLLVGLERA